MLPCRNYAVFFTFCPWRLFYHISKAIFNPSWTKCKNNSNILTTPSWQSINHIRFGIKRLSLPKTTQMASNLSFPVNSVCFHAKRTRISQYILAYLRWTTSPNPSNFRRISSNSESLTLEWPNRGCSSASISSNPLTKRQPGPTR